METIDTIIELLETGKSVHQQYITLPKEMIDDLNDSKDQSDMITTIINQLLGSDQTDKIKDYYNGNTSLQNTILRLVVSKNVREAPPLFPLYTKKTAKYTQKSKKNPRYTRRQCVDALYSAAEVLGPIFSIKDYNIFTSLNVGYPKAKSIRDYIGNENTNWYEMLRSIGLNIESLRLPSKLVYSC